MKNLNNTVLKVTGWVETIIGAVGLFFTAIFLYAEAMFSFGYRTPHDGYDMSGLGFTFILFFSLPLSVFFFLGMGVLKYRPWTRIAHLIIFSIILAVELFFLILLMLYSNSDFMWHIPGTIISGALVWIFARFSIREEDSHV